MLVKKLLITGALCFSGAAVAQTPVSIEEPVAEEVQDEDSLDQRFQDVVDQIRNSTGGSYKPSRKQKARFYGLYKRATVGPAEGKRPGKFKIVERYKWDAWKACDNMSADEAKAEYIRLFESLSA